MSWPWFGPIANNSPTSRPLPSSDLTNITHTVVTDFGISLDQVTWLGNLVALVYLPVSLAIPPFVKRFGLRRSVRCLSSLPPTHSFNLSISSRSEQYA
jgi:MFS transporter, FLVCR family, MFS-domain-containing protein 7